MYPAKKVLQKIHFLDYLPLNSIRIKVFFIQIIKDLELIFVLVYNHLELVLKNIRTVAAVMFSVPANGDFCVQAHILKDHKYAKNWRSSLNIKPSTIAMLRDRLWKVITEGTAR